jgi:hypothetical protein
MAIGRRDDAPAYDAGSGSLSYGVAWRGRNAYRGLAERNQQYKHAIADCRVQIADLKSICNFQSEICD